MSKNKYFRFWMRAYPKEHALQPGLGVFEQPTFIEMSPDESKAMDMRGMPLFVEHENGIKVKERKGADPLKIEYPQNKYVLGYIGSQITTEGGGVLLMGEIPLSEESDTSPEAVLRRSAVAMIRGGHYGVSLNHSIDQNHEPDADVTVVRKFPMEVSLTTKPKRAGSEIVSFYEADEPSFRVENNYDVYRASSESEINWTAVDTNKKRKLESLSPPPLPPSPNDMSAAQNSTSAAAAAGLAGQAQQGQNQRSLTADEIAAIFKEHSEMKQKLATFEPLANEYIAKKKADEAAARAKAAQNVAQLSENTQKLLKQLLETPNLDMKPEDRTAVQALVKIGESESEQKKPESIFSSITNTEGRDNNAPPTGQDLWNRVDAMIAQEFAPPVVACNLALGYLNQIIQAQQSDLASTARSAAKTSATSSSSAAAASTSAAAASTATSAPKIASQQQQQKRAAEPDFGQFDLKRMSEYAARRAAVLELDDGDIPK
jgi:hypothetical protein